MREYTCIHRDYPMPLTFVETNMDIARIKARMLLRSPRRLDRYVPLVDIAVIDVDASGRDRTISEYLLRANPVVKR